MRKLTALLLATALAACNAADEGPACDRACLIEIADGYLAAIAAHEPEATSLSTDVAFVENITGMKPGQGLWSSAAGRRRWRATVRAR